MAKKMDVEEMKNSLFELRQKLAGFEEKYSDKMHEMKDDVSDKMRDIKSDVSRQVRDKSDEFEKSVAKKPIKSVGIAFAAGLVAGLVAFGLMRKK